MNTRISERDASVVAAGCAAGGTGALPSDGRAAGGEEPAPAVLMLADVEELAGRIGPRGTGTSAERAAGDHVAARLATLGIPATRTRVRAVADQNAFPLASVALTLLAVAVYPLGRAGRLAAAGLALPSAPLLWHAIRLSRSPLGPLLPKVTSGNVTAAIAPRGAPVRRVVLLAHLDTNRSRLAWRAGAVSRLERLAWLTLAMLAAPGALYAAGSLVGLGARPRRAGTLWYASLAPAAYAAGMLITLLRDWRAPFSPGAHDNAASVAVALELARRLATRPLACTEVLLAFTGAEETDHAGLVALLAQEPDVMRAADFVSLEGLGSGRLAYLTREGLCDHVRPDAALLAAAERAAARRPELGAAPAELLLEDEVTGLRRLGYRALCLAGYDPSEEALPHWHRSDDTPDTVSGAFMERAADFVAAVLEEIDGEEGPCGHS